MPSKTIYVKDEDLPLFERFANEKESISSMFAQFLRFEESMRKPQPMQLLPMPEVATLRDQFAMAAMTGDWGRDDGVWANTLPGPMGDLTAAKRYYEMADAMLKARNAIAVSGYDEDGNPICEHGNRINCDPCFKCEAKKGK